MPLDRAHVTIASRVMMYAYPLFATAVGVSFATMPQERIDATAGIRFVDSLLPLWIWGVGFLVIAAVLIMALSCRRRSAYIFALSTMTVWMAVWALLLFASAMDGGASWSAWTWPGFIGVACWATILSLHSREGVA